MLIALDARFPYLLVVDLFAEDAVLAERRPGQWSAQGDKAAKIRYRAMSRYLPSNSGCGRSRGSPSSPPRRVRRRVDRVLGIAASFWAIAVPSEPRPAD